MNVYLSAFTHALNELLWPLPSQLFLEECELEWTAQAAMGSPQVLCGFFETANSSHVVDPIPEPSSGTVHDFLQNALSPIGGNEDPHPAVHLSGRDFDKAAFRQLRAGAARFISLSPYLQVLFSLHHRL